MDKKQLTIEEERAREKAMDFYRYVGKSEMEANRLAWEDIKREFPRLQESGLAGERRADTSRSIQTRQVAKRSGV